MQPQDKRSRSHTATDVRLRTYLKADLGWLPGFPVSLAAGSVNWMPFLPPGPIGTAEDETLPDNSSVRLDRDCVRRGMMLFNTLSRDFPRALNRVLSDPGAWRRNVPLLLEWLNTAVHQTGVRSTSVDGMEIFYPTTVQVEAEEISRLHPGLESIVQALGWIHALEPRRFRTALRFVDENAAALETILRVVPPLPNPLTTTPRQPPCIERSFGLILKLEALAAETGAKHIQPLLNLIGDVRMHRVQSEGIHRELEARAELLRKWARTAHYSPLGEVEATPPGTILPDWTEWLYRREHAFRLRALDLVPLVFSRELIGVWESFWARDSPRAAFQQLSWVSLADRDEAASLAERLLERTLSSMPAEFQTKNLLRAIETTAQEKTRFLTARTLLTLLPTEALQSPVRAAFLDHLANLWQEEPSAAASLSETLIAYFRQPYPLERLLAPWQPMIRAWQDGDYTSDSPTFHALRNHLDLERTRAAMLALAVCDDVQWSENLLRIYFACTRSHRAATDAIETVRTVAAARNQHLLPGLDESATRIALAHAFATDQESLLRLVPHFSGRELEGTDCLKALLDLAKDLHRAECAPEAVCLLVDGLLPSLLALAERRFFLRTRGVDVPLPVDRTRRSAPETDAAWIRQYPAPLRPAIADLAAVDADAENCVRWIFAEMLPDKDSLSMQLTALEERLSLDPTDVRLIKGRENLRRWLDARDHPSKALLARINTRLQRARRRALLELWTAQTNAIFREELSRHLQISDPPTWLYASHHLRILARILEMRPSLRALGLRILRMRCGPRPWSLAAEPANQAFLARLRARGVDPDPWLRPLSPIPWLQPDGRHFEIVFEDDPLEIFQMGSHFNTCLSIDQFNFFATLGNIADVNKHVLYARDDYGHVFGRSLLALTREGYLVAFHPYCHDPQVGFPAKVGEVVDSLAEEMHTVVVPHGEVPQLVASDWYSDDPIALSGRFAFLAPDGDFNMSLVTMEAGAFVPALRSLVAPEPLDPVTLSYVLELPALVNRPQLVLRLVEILERTVALSERTRIRAACMAYAAGDRSFALRTLRSASLAELRHFYTTGGCITVDNRLHRYFWTALVECGPTRALRLLRVLRRGRPMEDEWDPLYREGLLMALLALGRETQAKRLQEVWASDDRTP